MLSALFAPHPVTAASDNSSTVAFVQRCTGFEDGDLDICRGANSDARTAISGHLNLRGPRANFACKANAHTSVEQLASGLVTNPSLRRGNEVADRTAKAA